MSKPTFYKYVDLQVIMLTNLDLPKKVKYKKRKENKAITNNIKKNLLYQLEEHMKIML
jgi:hypothetical protein